MSRTSKRTVRVVKGIVSCSTEELGRRLRRLVLKAEARAQQDQPECANSTRRAA